MSVDLWTTGALDLTTWIMLTALIGLLAMSAFFSSSETSLFSLDAVDLDKMERDRSKRLTLIRRLLAEPRRLIVTILIGNELVNVAASVISASLVIRFFGAENTWLNLVIMVPALLVFGEITPKTLAYRRNIAFATRQAYWIDLFARLITPVRWVVRRVADFFITLAVGPERSAANIVTEDMVRSLADEAVGEGALDRSEARYIQRIFDFGNKEVKELMTPRSKMQTFVLGDPMSETVAALGKTGHTKVPVFETDEDETVVGLLHARDLVGKLTTETTTVTKDILRDPLLVPESKSAAALFHDFRRRQLSIAIVLDEFGGITGLVTMEDLLEEIFGAIPSRSDLLKEEALHLERLGDGSLRVDGRASLQRFNEVAEAGLTNETAESIGGVVLDALGELPTVGDTVVVDQWRFRVEELDGHRIAVVVAEPADAKAGDSDTQAADKPVGTSRNDAVAGSTPSDDAVAGGSD